MGVVFIIEIALYLFESEKSDGYGLVEGIEVEWDGLLVAGWS